MRPQVKTYLMQWSRLSQCSEEEKKWYPCEGQSRILCGWNGNVLSGDSGCIGMEVPCYRLAGSLIPRLREREEKELVGKSKNCREPRWRDKLMA